MTSKNVFKKLYKNGLTIAFSESMSGGSLAFELIKNEGASKVVLGSLVVYQNHMKAKLLDIHPNVIIKYGVISKEISELMASQTYKIFQADITVAVTGNASPNHHPRICYVSILFEGSLKTYLIEFEDETRLKAIQKTNQFVYQKLAKKLASF